MPAGARDAEPGAVGVGWGVRATACVEASLTSLHHRKYPSARVSVELTFRHRQPPIRDGSRMARQDGDDGIETPPEHPRPPSASRATAGGYTIGIRRTGAAVTITLTAGSEYAGMELYDSLVRSAESGCLRLEMKLPRS